MELSEDFKDTIKEFEKKHQPGYRSINAVEFQRFF